MYGYRKKNIIMVVMMVAVLFMAVGYALLSTTLNISGISDLTGSWGVKITSVTYQATGKAYNISEPTYTDTTVKFNVGVKVPGDRMTFSVTVQNSGNIDALLMNIDASASGTESIIYSIDGISSQEVLKAGDSKTFTVSTYFDINATSLPIITTKDLTVRLNYVQYDEQTLNAIPPVIEDTTTQYGIMYMGNGGIGSIEGTVCTKGESCTLRTNTYTRSGYAFLGWSTSPIAGLEYTDGETKTDITTPSKTLVLYAAWKRVTPVNIANKILTSNTPYADNVASPNVTNSTGIDFGELYTPHIDGRSEATETITFSTTDFCAYGNEYTFSSEGGEYGVTGTTDMGACAEVDNYTQYKYVCLARPAWVTGPCSELYEIVSYTDATTATAYVHRRKPQSTIINGKGLYYTSTNTEDNKTTYYFRGDVDNNYVQFGKDSSGNDILWRIVRINEDGGLRLVTTKSVGQSAFNSASADYGERYLGYMNGGTDSTIKTNLDNWYINNSNLNDYIDLMSLESGFCNDRKVSSTTSDTTYYSGNDRITNRTPQFACPQTDDLFTTSASTKGNQELTYPVGLLTADELIYAGVIDSTDRNVLLEDGESLRTMTPMYVDSTFAYVWHTYNGSAYDYAGYTAVMYPHGVYPVINLKAAVMTAAELSKGCTEQNGTKSCPYIIGGLGSDSSSGGDIEEETTYTVTFASSDTTQGTVTPGSATTTDGGSVTVTLAPADGYEYTSNTCGGVVDGNTMTVSNITQDTSCTVTFEPVKHTVTVSVIGVSGVSPLVQTVSDGGSVNFSLVDITNTGYKATSNTCGGTILTQNMLLISNVTKDISCSVTLEPAATNYTVTIMQSLLDANGVGVSTTQGFFPTTSGTAQSLSLTSSNGSVSFTYNTTVALYYYSGVSCTLGNPSVTHVGTGNFSGTITLSNISSTTMCTVTFRTRS